jgi:hypothetical protein
MLAQAGDPVTAESSLHALERGLTSDRTPNEPNLVGRSMTSSALRRQRLVDSHLPTSVKPPASQSPFFLEKQTARQIPARNLSGRKEQIHRIKH